VTAKRELFEETGLVADELELFNIYSGEITRYQYTSGDITYGVDIVYICKKYHGELKPQKEEVKQLTFMKLADIKGKLSPRNKQIIKDLYERL
ncbi:MAG: NUDIX domain-containing protein, partial [Bacilli bacterium]|nr:NUDIX domain-containing protein [Bacilli bacterium]